MSSFDEKFLKIFNSLHPQTREVFPHPTLWENISSCETFKKKLSATAELGVFLCDSFFDWKEEEILLKEENILVPNFKYLLESISQAKNLSVLESVIDELTKILGLKESELIEVAVAIHSFFVKDDFNKTSELFLATRNSKSLLQSLSVFPFFCMNKCVFG